MAASVSPVDRDNESIPMPSGLAAIHLPLRDAVEARRFYTEVLGGELIEDGPRLTIKFADFSVFLVPHEGGVTPLGAEYPHYALSVTPEQFVGLKRRLDAYGVPTGKPWTRKGHGTALMYFRDPTGNQWELYSKTGCPQLDLVYGARRGGDYVTDFPALAYRHLTPPAPGHEPPAAAPSGWNHMTLAVRDLGETERFQTIVLGGTITQFPPGHLTVNIGGVSVGSKQSEEGWTASDAEYPHYTFNVKPETLLPLKRRLESFGVLTHDIATHDGTDAWMYFRDPSDNLWELNCPRGFAGPTRRTPSAGGDFIIDVKALSYRSWKDPGKTEQG